MNKANLRVMQVISNLDVGGAQEVVRTLAENLSEAGCPTVVCAFRDGPLRKEIERAGVPVEILPGRRYSVLAFPLFLVEMFRLRRRLLRLVRKYRVNVVQTHLLRVLDFLVLSLKLSEDLQIYWTIQNANFTLRLDHLARRRWLLPVKQAGYRFMYRLGLRWADGFIAVSDDVKPAILQGYGNLPVEKIAVICNSVDSRRYRRRVDRERVRWAIGLPPEIQLGSVVATFKEQKGHRFLIEALPIVVRQHPDFHVAFIGDGELREDLVARAHSSGLADHIHFLGTRSDVPDLLAASDYFILPSLWEGLPMALVEAMASGLPIVATEVSGNRQVIAHEETGLLVPPGQPGPLAAAIIDLLDNPERARSMGDLAMIRVEENYGARKQAMDHITLFNQNGLEANQPVKKKT